MVTIYRTFGFRVVIYPSGREHGPPHVHVFNADGEAKIALGGVEEAPSLLLVVGMRRPAAVRALRIVEERQETFLARWREYHGP